MFALTGNFHNILPLINAIFGKKRSNVDFESGADPGPGSSATTPPDEAINGDDEPLNGDNILSYLDGLFSSVGAENAANRRFNATEALKNRNFQAQEAQKNRDWSTEMDNTQYQRRVDDMSKAGLNPALAAMSGGSSATSTGAPAGATASYQTGGGDTFSSILSSIAGMTSALSNFFAPSEVTKILQLIGSGKKNQIGFKP